MASTARDTQLFSRLTRAPSSDSGSGPERPSSVSRWHWVLVVRQQSATMRWARVYRRATSRNRLPAEASDIWV